MNPEDVYVMCMSFPHAVDTLPFDDSTLVFKVGGKMFALYPLENPHLLMVKCDPIRAVELRELYPEINAAWHLNKKHWNQIDISGSLPSSLIREMVAHSYSLVVAKLPRKTKDQFNINSLN